MLAYVRFFKSMFLFNYIQNLLGHEIIFKYHIFIHVSAFWTLCEVICGKIKLGNENRGLEKMRGKKNREEEERGREEKGVEGRWGKITGK